MDVCFNAERETKVPANNPSETCSSFSCPGSSSSFCPTSVLPPSGVHLHASSDELGALLLQLKQLRKGIECGLSLSEAMRIFQVGGQEEANKHAQDAEMVEKKNVCTGSNMVEGRFIHTGQLEELLPVEEMETSAIIIGTTTASYTAGGDDDDTPISLLTEGSQQQEEEEDEVVADGSINLASPPISSGDQILMIDLQQKERSQGITTTTPPPLLRPTLEEEEEEYQIMNSILSEGVKVRNKRNETIVDAFCRTCSTTTSSIVTTTTPTSATTSPTTTGTTCAISSAATTRTAVTRTTAPSTRNVDTRTTAPTTPTTPSAIRATSNAITSAATTSTALTKTTPATTTTTTPMTPATPSTIRTTSNAITSAATTSTALTRTTPATTTTTTTTTPMTPTTPSAIRNTSSAITSAATTRTALTTTTPASTTTTTTTPSAIRTTRSAITSAATTRTALTRTTPASTTTTTTTTTPIRTTSSATTGAATSETAERSWDSELSKLPTFSDNSVLPFSAVPLLLQSVVPATIDTTTAIYCNRCISNTSTPLSSNRAEAAHGNSYGFNTITRRHVKSANKILPPLPSTPPAFSNSSSPRTISPSPYPPISLPSSSSPTRRCPPSSHRPFTPLSVPPPPRRSPRGGGSNKPAPMRDISLDRSCEILSSLQRPDRPTTTKDLTWCSNKQVDSQTYSNSSSSSSNFFVAPPVTLKLRVALPSSSQLKMGKMGSEAKIKRPTTCKEMVTKDKTEKIILNYPDEKEITAFIVEEKDPIAVVRIRIIDEGF